MTAEIDEIHTHISCKLMITNLRRILYSFADAFTHAFISPPPGLKWTSYLCRTETLSPVLGLHPSLD
jgi:hypothetical protein